MEPERWEEKPGSVGRPLDNLMVSIVDEQGNALHAGQVGELLVKGPSICSGYLNDPEETRRIFCDGWLRTGDLARKDEEGYLWIEGRKQAFVKMRGMRVSLAEVEERATAIPGVYERAACAVDHPEVGEAVVLFALTSSATTSQLPSRVVLDSPTARRMTKGVVITVRDFIGSARRPYLVVDAPSFIEGGNALGARLAAIQGLHPFATETTYCLNVNDQGDLTLDQDRLREFAKDQQDAELLVYGFTSILWSHLVKPLLAKGICLDLPKAWVLHSGGWKRLQDQAIEKALFNDQLVRVFGCSPDRIIDFYGMVESVGVIFPDCSEGNKHAPVFGDGPRPCVVNHIFN